MRQHVQALLAGLDRARHIPVVAGPPDGGWAADLASMGVSHHPLPIPATFSPLADLHASRRLRSLLRDIEPDLVHCHGSKAALVARLAVGSRSPLPVLYTVHGASAPGSPVLGALVALMERGLAARTTGYIAVSKVVAGGLRRWGVPPDRVAVIYNGIAVERFAGLPDRAEAKRMLGLDPQRPLVGMVARAVWEKGPDIFVRAAALVARRRPDCRFLLAGSGPALEETRRLAGALGVGGSFLFLGHRGDVPLLLAAMDVFVQPSRSEGLGVGILEAMAAGRAVVASMVGGIPEIVDDRVTGLLVPPGEASPLCEAVLRLLDNEDLRHRLAVAGCRRARRDFDVAGAVRATAGIYDRLLAGAEAVRLRSMYPAAARRR